MGIYASRQSRLSWPPGQPKGSDQHVRDYPEEPLPRVRILSGPLAGLICDVVSTADSERWLLRPALEGVFLRVSPDILQRLETS